VGKKEVIMKDAIYEELKEAFMDYDEDVVLELIPKALEAGASALEVMDVLSGQL
jgi:methanogenic corrinoid protein MtbC1